MGGFLSGNRSIRYSTKTTVEQCYTLNVGLLLRDGHLWHGAEGSMSWTHGFTRECLASVGFTMLSDDGDNLVLRLNYRIGGCEDIELKIRLQTTTPQFGGVRWWLTCPLMTDDGPCERRVAKLHFRNRYFGCRQCLDLTYHSSQHAHEYERAIASTPRFLLGFENFMEKAGQKLPDDWDSGDSH